MSGFTKGPWEIRAPNIFTIDRSVKPDGRRRIASLIVAYKGSEEYYANAHLIAAAPELYEALEALCDSIEREEELNSSLSGVLMSDMREGRSALAKARGES